MNRIRDSESLPDEAKSATQSGSAKTAWVKSKFDVLTAFVARWFTPSHPTEPKTREQIESELAIPALALTVIGVGGLLLRLLMVLLNPWSLGSFYYFTFEFWMGMTFAAGAIATFTGMSLKSLQNFRSVVVGCVWVLALFGILWPATLPFAIWALVILRHPSAKTHFTDVPLSECRAWITPRDLAIRWWSRGCEWFQFVWPKIRVAIFDQPGG